MNSEQLQTAIEFGREQSGIEFKSPGRRDDKYYFAKVTRAALSMANKRDGGHVILGVEETPAGLVATGLNQPDLETWAQDHVADALAVYADPSIQFDITTPKIGAATLVAIRVQ